MRGFVGCSMLGALLLLPLSACAADSLVAIDRLQVDEDYAIQGEYVGEVSVRGEDVKNAKVGAHVIARGDGKFDVVFYGGKRPGLGGLPGADWDGENIAEGNAVRTSEGDIVVYQQDTQEVEAGRIEDGKLILDCDEVQGALERVERKSETLGAEPPKSATIIVGNGVNNTDGRMNTKDQLWAGATTNEAFDGPYHLHMEFLLPYMPKARGQGRANSGVYLHDCYELQVLDSFGLEGRDNECGGIYKVKTPDVNMCLPPLQWQTYDIDFTPPVFEGNVRKAPARLTVKHNGVTIHDDIELDKTPGRQGEGPGPRPIHLQQHGNKVQYRNVWLVEE